MESKETLIVGDFLFRSLEDATLGEKELGQIVFLEERIDYSKPDEVMGIYKKILQNRLFQTPIGLLYLQKIRENLVENYKGPDPIPSIMLYTVYQRKIRENPQEIKSKIKRQTEKDSNKKLKMSMICNVALFLLIILMFFISLNGNNPTILNYEDTILNKYSDWESELTEREEKIRALERENLK